MNNSLSTFGAIWLVAKREIGVNLRAKSTIITTAIMAILIVGGLVAFKVMAGNNDVAFGYVENQLEQSQVDALTQSLEAAGSAPEAIAFESEEKLNEAITEGTVDSGVVSTDLGLNLIANETPDNAVMAAVSEVQQRESLTALAAELPGGAENPTLNSLLSPVPVEVLQPPTEVEGSQAVVGFLVGFLLYLGIFGGGMAVAQGVVEEKSSRVVEVLLASVRPWQLLLGKVLGIGIASLVQVGTYVLAGVVTVKALGMAQELPFDIASVGGWVLLWFLIGYFVYAFIFAGLGALVSRQEDLGSAITLPMMLIIVGYIIGVSIAPNDPDSPIVAVASFVPFTSPIVMPIRSAYGVASTAEVWIAVAIGLITLPLLLWLTSKIYANGVRRSGAKIKLRDAIKG